MINYIAIIVCIFSVLFSLIEGSNYLDTHHDAIIFSNSIIDLVFLKDFILNFLIKAMFNLTI